MPYPTLFPLGGLASGLYCYVMPHYGTDGLSVLVERVRDGGDAVVRISFSDWRGGPVAPGSTSEDVEFTRSLSQKFVEIMGVVGVPAAQYYLVPAPGGLMLTDVRVGPARLAGPGMVRDLLSKIVPVPDTIKVTVLDQETVGLIERGHGVYAGDLILKPSVFRTVENDTLGTCPLYFEVRR